MKKYETIIFDLGKVVFDLSFDKVFQFWATASGKQFNDIKSHFHFDELFNQFERDEITEEKFRTKISKQLDLKLTDEIFDNGWCSLYLDTYNGIDNLLINLKQDYTIIALTNTNIIHHRAWKIKYATTLEHFEKIFCSHELKARKPEKELYHIVLNDLKAKPSEMIFLDDNIDNINGALDVGMKAILVTSQQQMYNELLIAGVIN